MAESKQARMERQELEEQVLANRKKAREHQKEWRVEAKEDFEFYANRQYSDEEEAILEEEGRPNIIFNRMSVLIDAVHGHQINNEQDIKFYPREMNDEGASEVYQAAMRWADDQCDALEEVNDAFLDMLISGIGACEMYMSYDEDPDGMLRSASRIYPLELGWDWNAKKRNLTDARFVFRDRMWLRKDAEKKWPKVKDIISMPRDDDVIAEMAEPHDASRAWKYDNNQPSDYYDEKVDEVRITQYQWWEHTPVYRVHDPRTGKIIQLDQRRFERMKEFLEMQNVRYIKQMKRSYKQGFFMGKHLLEEPEDIDAGTFTIKFMTGKRDANKNLWYGLVRPLKDPARWSNKFFSEVQDFLRANRQGGAFVEADAFENRREAEEQWNRNDAMITVASGAISQGKIKERTGPPYPQGLDRLMQIAISAHPEVSGVNPELMGLVDRNQPGVVESQRRQSSVNTLATFFNSLRKFQRERGRLGLYFIKNYLTDGRLIRIMGEGQGQQLVPLIKKDTHDVKYDIVVDEAPTSVNQREQTFDTLYKLMPYLVKMGLPAPPTMMDYLPIPLGLRTEWKQFIQQSNQQKQQDPRKQVEIQDIQSRAQKNMAEANKKMAEAEDLKAEAQRTLANIPLDEIDTLTKN